MDITSEKVSLFDNEIRLLALTKNLTKIIGTTILNRLYYKFVPQGATFIAILSESSITIHTYPEKNLMCVEIHTCGLNSDVIGCIEHIEQLFGKNYVKNYTESGEF
jgi:S-adenosylmethionine/arginine decarboxylase-like enzyme